MNNQTFRDLANNLRESLSERLRPKYGPRFTLALDIVYGATQDDRETSGQWVASFSMPDCRTELKVVHTNGATEYFAEYPCKKSGEFITMRQQDTKDLQEAFVGFLFASEVEQEIYHRTTSAW